MNEQINELEIEQARHPDKYPTDHNLLYEAETTVNGNEI